MLKIEYKCWKEWKTDSLFHGVYGYSKYIKQMAGSWYY